MHVYQYWDVWYLVFSSVSFNYKSTEATKETGKVTNTEDKGGTDLN